MPNTILLADDSVTIQKVVAISFASEDVTVVTVDNGDDAIARAREIRPDIVLADVVMPGKNGYEVCSAIKADPDLKHIPVLLLTGTFEAFDESRAREVGSAGHVAKPFEAQALVGEVRRLIREAATSAPPAPAAAQAEPAQVIAAPDDAFDFFDDEVGGADLASEPEPIDAGDALDFDAAEDGFSFGDDDLSASGSAFRSAGASSPSTAPQAKAPQATPAPSAIGSVAAPARDASTDPVLDGEILDDSLAPDASRSGDQPFDFALAEETTDPLADLDLVPPVDADDLAQATVLDPLGASGYDVSSSDLGPPLHTPPASAKSAATRPDEAELTMLAAEPAPEARAWPGADPSANDLTTVLGETPAPEASKPPHSEPIAIEVTDDEPADLANELYAEPEVAAEPARARTDASKEALIASMGPELRRQLHDTLEKIAWESFGELTDEIVRASIERVEAIAWEVIPRMAETLIQEEIRRMKAEPDDA